MTPGRWGDPGIRLSGPRSRMRTSAAALPPDMPSDEDPPAKRPRFAAVDWEDGVSPSGPLPPARDVGAATVAAVVVAGAAYDAPAVGPDGRLPFGVELQPVDWLFLLSLLVAARAIVVPAIVDRGRAVRFWAHLRDDRLALACAGYLLALALGGTVGLWLFDATSTVSHNNHPPVLFSVPERLVFDCQGVVEAGRCHGTLAFPLGTNQHGESMVVLVLKGADVALRVGVIVGVLAGGTALVVGTVAGYAGGRVDAVLMRYVDVQQTVPAFVVYVVLIYVFGRSLFVLVLVFGLLSWGGIARVVRGEVVGIRSEGYVRAAVASGTGHLRILRRHVVPNVVGTAVVATTGFVPRVLLVEAAVSFLLLNDASVQSWGKTITDGFQHFNTFYQTWWISTIPAIALSLAVVSIAILGDSLRDYLDPEASQ